MSNMDRSSKKLFLPSLTNHPPRPHHKSSPLTPPWSHHYRYPHKAHSIVGDGHSNATRSSMDTPLSLYASTRAQFKSELENYTSTRRNTTQVPLSDICASQATLGAVGNPFNSTTKIKSLPLPTIYNRYQLSNRGIRNVGLHTNRYLPTSSYKRKRTVSGSLLYLSDLSTRQREHLLNREKDVSWSRSRQMEREIIPHRVEQSYYMNGHSAQLFNREEIPPNELEVLQNMAMSQNTNLYYGKGIKSFRGRASAQVKKFEDRLQESIAERSLTPNTGGYSRASRVVTPGSPIMEEGEEITEELPKKPSFDNKTFITQQPVSDQST